MPDLLRIARDHLQALKIPAHIDVLPPMEDVQALHGQKILLVDDSPEVFAIYVPLLVSATGGTAHFLLHRGEPINLLSEQILMLKPTIVLLDEYLAGGIRGHLVAAALRSSAPTLRIFGFSNAENARVLFEENGIAGFLFKDPFDPEATLRALARAVS